MKTFFKFSSWVIFSAFCLLFPIYYLFWMVVLKGITLPFFNLLTAISKILVMSAVIMAINKRAYLRGEDYAVMGLPFLEWIALSFVVYPPFFEVLKKKSAMNFFIVEPMIIDFLIAIYFGTKVYMMARRTEELKARRLSKILCGILLILVAIIPLAVPWMGE